MKYSLSSHSLIIPLLENRFLFYQAKLKQGLLADTQSLLTLHQYLNKQPLHKTEIKYQDVSEFSLKSCLLDNPSGLKDCNKVELKHNAQEGFIDTLIALDILVTTDDYLAKQGKKTNLFDRSHQGNFHQQIGDFMLSFRGDAEMWWIDQKFSKDYKTPKNNPYQWTQLNFMKQFFNRDFFGETWLDFGCGIGFYSHFFKERNAKVLGVDPSQKYIDIAKQNFSQHQNINFIQQSFEQHKDFDLIKEQRFDCIFMSDVFMYYFEPYKTIEVTASDLLQHLKSSLKPGGKIYIMDPHGCFHLQPWFAETEPFLICSEYKNRKYRVTPTLQEFSQSVEAAGLVISKVRELTIDESEPLNSQNKQANAEFPLWWFFELTVAS